MQKLMSIETRRLTEWIRSLPEGPGFDAADLEEIGAARVIARLGFAVELDEEAERQLYNDLMPMALAEEEAEICRLIAANEVAVSSPWNLEQGRGPDDLVDDDQLGRE